MNSLERSPSTSDIRNVSEIVESDEEGKEVIEMSQLKRDSDISALAKYQIEQELQPIFEKIQKEKNKQLAWKHLAYLTTVELFKDLKNHPLTTITKVSLVGLSLATLYPLVLSAIACLNPFRLQNPNDVFSSDEDVANDATQLYSNTGHAVGYLWEALGINACTLTLLLRPCYRRVAGKIIDKIYTPHMMDPLLSREKSDFLYQMRKRELAQYGFIAPLTKKIEEK